jgi:hypothetical protein
MKIIVQSQGDLVIGAYEDSVNIVLLNTCIEIYKQGYLSVTISCNNKSNAFVVENVSVPSDWSGEKYKYINNNFELNPDWVEVIIEEEPPVLASEIE